MELHPIQDTDLMQDPQAVMERVQRGQAIVVEHQGQPTVVIVDLVDFSLLRAVLRYYTESPQIDLDVGLPDEAVTQATDRQARYDLVLAHYLGGAISLARAGELLGLIWLDLRTRLDRWNLPLRIGPATLEEAQQEIATAFTWDQAPPTRRQISNRTQKPEKP